MQTKTITENITSTILEKVEEKIKPLAEENEKLRMEIQNLNKKLENIEAISKRNNVIIHGIPESNEEKQDDLNALLFTTLSQIDVEIEKTDINRVHRLGKKSNSEGKIRPILLATTTLQKKIQILQNKKKMKEGTYITQDLTKEAQLRNKEIKLAKDKGNDKRKRSETPSPKNTQNKPKNDTKIIRVDAFQQMRERSYSLSEKNTYRH